ncbi:MAG: glycosyltransferase [Gammaproteobacteria bacterium]
MNDRTAWLTFWWWLSCQTALAEEVYSVGERIPHDTEIAATTGYARSASIPSRTSDGKDAPIRVLFATDKLGYSTAKLHGAGRLTVEWSKAFDPARVEWHACVLRDPGTMAHELRQQNVPISFLNAGRFDPRTLWAFVHMIRKHHIDVLHVQEFGAGTLGRLAGLVTGTPTVLHVHAEYDKVAIPGYPWYVHRLDRMLASRTAHAVAVSEPVRQFAIARMGFRPEQVSVIHNPVSPRIGQPIPRAEIERLRVKYGFDADTPVIGAITRFHRYKGNHVLLEAFAHVRTRMPEARLLLIGDGPERAALEAQAASLGIRNDIIFAGFQLDISGHLELFTVAALPSLEEAFSVALAEAITAGVPVVASRVGSIPEVVSDGIDGFLVPPGQADALAEALLHLLRDVTLRAQFAAGARADGQRFSMGLFTTRMEEVYRGVRTRASSSS